ANQIDVGVVDHQSLRESAAVRESGLSLVLADLLISPGTPITGPAAADERRSHAFAAAPPGDGVADGHDHARPFVARDVRRNDVRVVLLPPVPVTTTHTRSPNLDDRAVRRKGRLRRVDHPQRTS